MRVSCVADSGAAIVDFDFNAETGEYGGMLKPGALDPASPAVRIAPPNHADTPRLRH